SYTVKLFCCFLILLVDSAAAQQFSSLRGNVYDSSGAAIAGATVTINNIENNFSYTTITSEDGNYQFQQVRPGNYTLRVEAGGFKSQLQEQVQLLIGTSTTFNITLEVGEINDLITIRSPIGAIINMEDATSGNPFKEHEIRSLPFLARNPINLLTLQPGVVTTGQSDTDRLFQGSAIKLDQREGVVNGIRGNQTNISIDGADANDFETQAAFSSTLPVTLDSLQEFRVITANGNSTDGVAAGAQIQLVTKGGTNQFHGNLREYHRNTVTAANSFFNNSTNVDKAKLLRNVFGGSVGGPIIKSRAFFFFDYEGRRDASESSQARTGPNDTLKKGVLTYSTTTGGVATLTPADILALDPAGLGVNQAALQYLSQYPVGNDPSIAPDGGLSLTGFRFNVPLKTNQNIYTGRFDFNLTGDGRHSIILRGILADIKTDLQPAQFPNLPASSLLLNNSKGVVVAYTTQLSPNIVNTVRYAFTRQGIENTGAKGSFLTTASYSAFYVGGDFFTGFARANGRIVPIHEIENDLVITRGKHSLKFGVSFRSTHNRRFSEDNSFPTYFIFPFALRESDDDPFNKLINDGDPNNDPADLFQFNTAFQSLTGTISLIQASFQVDPKTKMFLPSGTPQAREFSEDGIEFYIQD
ncbi:MAG: carboxypeptidase-like regulatory domain-containing protein, partial [Acidobacteriota bacterium]